MGNEGSKSYVEPDDISSAMSMAEDSPVFDADNRSCHIFINNVSNFEIRSSCTHMIEGYVDAPPPACLPAYSWTHCGLMRTDAISLIGSWGCMQFEVTEPSTGSKAKLVVGARKAYPAAEPPRVGAEIFRLGQTADDWKKIVQTTDSCCRQLQVGPKLCIVEASVAFNSVSMMHGLFTITEGRAAATGSGRCDGMAITSGMHPLTGMTASLGMMRTSGMRRDPGMLRVYLGKKNYGVDIDRVCAAVLSCAAIATGVVLTIVTSGAAGVVISSVLISFGAESLGVSVKEDFSWAQWAEAGAAGAAVSLITFGAGFATAGGVAEALLLTGAAGMTANTVKTIASTAGALVGAGVRMGAVHVFSGHSLSPFGLLAEGVQGLGDAAAGGMAALAVRFVDLARGGAAAEEFAAAQETHVLIEPERGPIFLGSIFSDGKEEEAAIRAHYALDENLKILRKYTTDVYKIHGEGYQAVWAGIYKAKDASNPALAKNMLYIVGHTQDVQAAGATTLAAKIAGTPQLNKTLDSTVLCSCCMGNNTAFCETLSAELEKQGMGAPIMAFKKQCSFWPGTPEPVVNCSVAYDSVTLTDGPCGLHPEDVVYFI